MNEEQAFFLAFCGAAAVPGRRLSSLLRWAVHGGFDAEGLWEGEHGRGCCSTRTDETRSVGKRVGARCAIAAWLSLYGHLNWTLAIMSLQ